MTRGAAANAILDAGRSKKRSLPPLQCFCPLALLLVLYLSFSLFHFFFSLSSSHFSTRLFRGAFLSLSFLLSPHSNSFFLLLPASLLPWCLTVPVPLPLLVVWCSPRGLPFSSLLMPRDRQMMIKKAPVRVRTTPRRPAIPACIAPCPHLPPPPPPLPPLPPPAILLSPLSLTSLHYTNVLFPPPAANSLFFFSVAWFPFVPSFLVYHYNPLSPLSPRHFFHSSRVLPSCGYTFVACIMVRGELLSEPLSCYYLLLIVSWKDVRHD